MPHTEDDQIEVSKTEVRQGTGPRQMVSVLTASVALAILVGAALIVWFYMLPQPAPPT
jgi:tRNA-binding EMAP/Myf-like protein